MLSDQDHVKPVVDEIYNYVLGAKVHTFSKSYVKRS